MPWSNQNGGGGPWGGGGGGNNQAAAAGRGGRALTGARRRRRRQWRPPDLEEIIRRSQDRFKNVLPGGFNGGVVAIVVLVVLVFIGIQSIYTVQPDERGVELRFGVPRNEISMPGLHFHLWPIETVEIVKVTEQQQNNGSARVLVVIQRRDADRRPETSSTSSSRALHGLRSEILSLQRRHAG